ncbi:MAG: ABC transporter permease [Acidobacteria bacterium]|nr:ABC transporter permease [Acidobacteriota bacterium]
MKIWDLIRIANRNLFRSKLRTFLTVMAIFVGSFTLTLTNGIGDGLRDYVEKQVKSIEGTSILFVRKKFENEDQVRVNNGAPEEYKETTEDDAGNKIDPNSIVVSLEQIERLAKEFPEVKSVTPSYPMKAEYIQLEGGKKFQVSLGMLSEGLEQKLEAGKMFDGDNQIILPLSLAKAYDEKVENLVGKTVAIGYLAEESEEIKTKNLKIAGVARKGLIANINSFVDMNTARQIYTDQRGKGRDFNRFSSFTFRLNSSDAKVLESIKTKLDKKGFTAMSLADIEKRTYSAIGILQIGLNLFALIALLAASFGIINTLIIAVMERTKDIGLQKALGMGRGKIFGLFSFESILIGFWGALLGILGGIFIGVIGNWYLSTAYLDSFEGYRLFVFAPFSLLAIMLLVCTIAFLAGVLPAFRASRLNPIEALRYE